ncbi:hypothetical protein ACGFK1_03105 [Mycobacterium sp. NPDC048908]|uniref:hypothetical protein n=1 Tax=Mycobacterium sp. NPDC048908 TaxID=3364292 RepID=UPI00371350B1
MATRSYIADDKTTAGVLPADSVPSGAGALLRYQLNVVATTAQDVPQSAGGWLCDRARAGWDVNVTVAAGDARPLTILGVTPLDVEEGLLSTVRNSAPGGTLAVGADVLASDADVRAEVSRVLGRGATEVIVWGRRWPTGLGRAADTVTHRVSTAARAFKSHALLAAGLVVTDAGGATEELFRVETKSIRPLHSV